MTWQPITTAPKDGTLILLLFRIEDTILLKSDGQISHLPPHVAIGKWDPKGYYWVDENGHPDGTGNLMQTGIWDSQGGWFYPSEIMYWCPIPELPEGR